MRARTRARAWRYGLAAACVLGLAGAEVSAESPPKANTPPEPIQAKALVGYVLETERDGYTSYELQPKGRVVYASIGGTRGTGTWTANKKGLLASGKASGGCSIDDDDTDCARPWSVELTDLTMSSSGVLIATESPQWPGEDRARLVFLCEDKRCSVTSSLVVGVLPGSQDRALLDAAMTKLLADPYLVLVAGEPAKNPRETSEIWWVPGRDAQHTAKRLAEKLIPEIGAVKPQKWTFGPSRYDVIVVVGEHRAQPPPAAGKKKP